MPSFSLVIPEGFFTEAIRLAAQQLQHEDASGQLLEDNPIMIQCCNTGYNQIIYAARREFHYEYREERYENPGLVIDLRSIPLTSGKPFRVFAGELEDTEVRSYSLRRNNLILDTEYDIVTVMSHAGFTTVADSPQLTSALVQQTIAVYNRRDTLGYVSVSGPNGVSKSPNDQGSILVSVLDLIQPLAYYGCGYRVA